MLIIKSANMTNMTMNSLNCNLFGFRFYSKKIVSFLAMREDMRSIESMPTLLSSNSRSLLISCLPDILVHILPLFAVAKKSEVRLEHSLQKCLVPAVKCYDMLVKELTIKVRTEEVSLDFLFLFFSLNELYL